jgi:MFS family permease
VLAASQLVGGAFRIGGGIWSDRIGRRIDPVRHFALALTIALAIVTALTDAPLALLVPTLVLATGTSMGWNSLSFAAAAELGGPARSGAAIGVQQTALALASSIVPLGFAALVARWSWEAAFAVATFFPLAGWFVLRPLGERRALAGAVS